MFNDSLHRPPDDEIMCLEYHEFVESLIRLAVLRYCDKARGQHSRIGVIDAVTAFIHNNFRFARGGTNLEVKETKI